MLGQIKSYKAGQGKGCGFGFIYPSEQAGIASYFFHISSCNIEEDQLKPGLEVLFDIGTNARSGKTEAQNVQLLY